MLSIQTETMHCERGQGVISLGEGTKISGGNLLTEGVRRGSEF
jgi:hypothetical protein